MDKEQIWQEGYSAYNAGTDEFSNPYEGQGLNAEYWSDGFEDAQEDERLRAVRSKGLYSDPRDSWMDKEFTLYSSGLFSKSGFDNGDIFEEMVSKCSSHLPSHVLVKVVKKYLIPSLNVELEIYESNTSHNPIRAEFVEGVELKPEFVTVTGKQVLELC